MSAAVDTPPPPSDSTEPDVMLLPSPRLPVVSFAVSVPASMDTITFDDDHIDFEEDVINDNTNEDLFQDTVGAAMAELGISRKPKIPPPKTTANKATDMGMVGTILFLKTSILVWFGWGNTTTASTSTTTSNNGPREGVNHCHILGSLQASTQTPMGHLLVAMPPRKFGSSPEAAESSTSKLIGGEYLDDETLAKQMACRLSQKSKQPVVVSCHLDPSFSQNRGLDPDLLHARAAALVEQRVWQLVKEQQDNRSIKNLQANQQINDNKKTK